MFGIVLFVVMTIVVVSMIVGMIVDFKRDGQKASENWVGVLTLAFLIWIFSFVLSFI